MLTLPACTHTIAGPDSAGSRSARMRPWPSTGTLSARLRPKPRMPSDLVSEGWASSPTTTVTGGAPISPCASTSQPARASTAWRAAASAHKLATVAPVTNAPAHSGGSCNTSSSQRNATCSNTAVPGLTRCSALFWSHALASQLRCQRDRQRTADHEAEEARAGHRHGGGRAELVEHAQREHRVASLRGQRHVERGQARNGVGARGDRARIQAVEVARGARAGVAQQVSGRVVEHACPGCELATIGTHPPRSAGVQADMPAGDGRLSGLLAHSGQPTTALG